MSTRAIQFLRQHRITHDILSYDPKELGAVFAALALDFPLIQTIKTLVVTLDSQRSLVVLIPGDCQASLKKVAAVCNVKRAAMASRDLAQRLTGYQVGGISPFGIRADLPVLMEWRLLDYTEVLINGGKRGIMLKMNPREIADALKAKTIDLAQQNGSPSSALPPRKG